MIIYIVSPILCIITFVNTATLPNVTNSEHSSSPNPTTMIPPEDTSTTTPVSSPTIPVSSTSIPVASPSIPIETTDVPITPTDIPASATENTAEKPQNLTEDDIIHKFLFKSRRILYGKEVGDTRPYMVYLRAIDKDSLDDPTWTCGGVIIHPLYILTSAACIEDANHFLIVSGTHRWIRNDETNECIEYGAKKAVSKCVPRNYVFDGHMFDNTKWMRSDIAVVKVDEPFNLKKRVRGCDFIPSTIAINNKTAAYEAPGTIGSIAGWGTTGGFAGVREANNSQEMLEVDVKLVSTEYCKQHWPPRYHYIINHNIICSQDTTSDISKICGEKDCMELYVPQPVVVTPGISRRSDEPHDFEMEHMKNAHKGKSRRTGGGFCNNDHGGPLVVGQGNNAVVAGIISACQHDDLTHMCRGPFLYTSVWQYKHMINCVIGDITCPLEEWMYCCVLEDKVN